MSLKKIIQFSILLWSLLGLQGFAYADSLDYIRLGGDERERLTGIYSQAYGFPGHQVAPVLAGPAGEAPAILQIAKSAGTLPLAVWSMRRMGMSYGNILSRYALGPSIYSGAQALPQYDRWTDARVVREGRLHLIRDIIRVRPSLIPYFPLSAKDFISTLLYPYHPKHGHFVPPGHYKKYGYYRWIPPGQWKKMTWGHPGKGRKAWAHPAHGLGKAGKGHKVYHPSKSFKSYKGKGAKPKGGVFKGGGKGKKHR